MAQWFGYSQIVHKSGSEPVRIGICKRMGSLIDMLAGEGVACEYCPREGTWHIWWLACQCNRFSRMDYRRAIIIHPTGCQLLGTRSSSRPQFFSKWCNRATRHAADGTFLQLGLSGCRVVDLDMQWQISYCLTLVKLQGRTIRTAFQPPESGTHDKTILSSADFDHPC